MALLRGLFVTAIVASWPALAPAGDLVSGLAAYDRQDFVEARRLLQEYAEIGNARAQFAIGAMLVQGSGGEKDVPAGLGWLLSSAQNGLQLAREQAPRWLENKSNLSSPERARLEQVIAAYGAEAVKTRLLPLSSTRGCSGSHPVAMSKIIAPGYPESARRSRRNASVLVRFVVGVDGLAREPRVMAAFPERAGFEETAVRAVLSSRFWPAEFEGHPVEGEADMKFLFEIIGGGFLWNAEALKTVQKEADAGVVSAQYLVGSVVLSDNRVLGVSPGQGLSYIGSAAQSGDPRAEAWIAEELASAPWCQHMDSARRWAGLAAKGGNPLAQVMLARLLLKDNPSPELIAQARAHLVSAAGSTSEFALLQAIGVLATSPFESLRDRDAVKDAVNRLKIDVHAADPHAWEALAAARALLGDFGEAAEHQQKALRLAEGYRWNTAAVAERLERYRQRTTWQGELFALPPAAAPVPISDWLHKCYPSQPAPFCVREFPPPPWKTAAAAPGR